MGSEIYQQVFYRCQSVLKSDVRLYIQGAGLVRKFPDYSHKSIMPSTLFEYIIDGSGYIKQGGTEYTVTKGDFVIVRESKSHQPPVIYGSDKNDPYMKIWFAAKGKFVDALLDVFDVSKKVTIKKCNVLNLFQMFTMSLTNDSHDTLASMTSILSIMQTAFDTPNAAETPDDFDKLIDGYLEQHLQDALKVSVAAKHFGLSQNNFNAYFQKRFGANYKRVMRMKQLDYAKELLKNTKYTISEIALYSGFFDQSYFSKCFYKEFGVYPTQYREKNK